MPLILVAQYDICKTHVRQIFGGHIGFLVIYRVKYHCCNFQRCLLVLIIYFCSVFNNQFLVQAWINRGFYLLNCRWRPSWIWWPYWKKKVRLSLQYERAHPNAQISCLYDKTHTSSWIMHHSAGLLFALILDGFIVSTNPNLSWFLNGFMIYTNTNLSWFLDGFTV